MPQISKCVVDFIPEHSALDPHRPFTQHPVGQSIFEHELRTQVEEKLEHLSSVVQQRRGHPVGSQW